LKESQLSSLLTKGISVVEFMVISL